MIGRRAPQQSRLRLSTLARLPVARDRRVRMMRTEVERVDAAPPAASLLDSDRCVASTNASSKKPRPIPAWFVTTTTMNPAD